MKPDYQLLRQWLRLAPEGSWPPSAQELLGLAQPPATATPPLNPEEIEARVLERLDWLRPYQLKYPELVTEGMNRLAQALLEIAQRPRPCWAGPSSQSPTAAAVETDTRSEEAPAITFTQTQPEGEKRDVQAAREQPPALHPPPPFPPTPPPSPQPVATVAGTQEVPASHQDTLVPAVAAAAWPAPQPLPMAPPLPRWAQKSPDGPTRRQLYRRLVRLRRLWHTWCEIGEILTASTFLDDPLSLLRFHTVHRQLREHVRFLNDLWSPAFASPGAWAAALLRQEHAVPLLRELEPEQRLRFLLDWRRGEEHLATLYQQLRQQLHEQRHARIRRPRWWLRLARWMCQPESILVLLLALMLWILWLQSS
jgi:hypothetical protein